MATINWRFLATVVRVIDGDTVIVDLDLGFYVRVRMSCRLARCNAIELGQPGGAAGKRALEDLLPVGLDVAIDSVSVDKYAGRFDGLIWLPDGRNVTDTMVGYGFAAAWNGKGARPVPPWPIP